MRYFRAASRYTTLRGYYVFDPATRVLYYQHTNEHGSPGDLQTIQRNYDITFMEKEMDFKEILPPGVDPDMLVSRGL